MKDKDIIRLQHMLDAAREIISIAKRYTDSDAQQNRIISLALMKEIEIIGEAAANISKETRDSLQHIEWSKIIGMRNILIHVYFKINQDIIMDTAYEDIPELIAELEKISCLK